jgi:RNA polymerase sigma-B factor
MANEQINALFQRYKQTKDVAIRNEIAEKYLYIADFIAKKFVGRGVEYDDLKQVASLAIVRGVERFDPDLNMQFTTFITPTVTGEIKNYFRDKSRLVKLPRRLGEIASKIKEFAFEYEGKYGVKPSVTTIAEQLGFSEEEVVQALEVTRPVSLDTAMVGVGEDTEALYDVLENGCDEYEDADTREVVRAAMHDFTDVERAIIKHRFEDELSQSETAKRLGVSQMYVSRMEKKLFAKLRDRLKDLN